MKRILRKRILLIIGVVIVFFVFLIFTINQEQVLTKDLVSRTQKEKIDTFVKIKSGSIIKTFIEKESGLNDDRPELKKAIKKLSLKTKIVKLNENLV